MEPQIKSGVSFFYIIEYGILDASMSKLWNLFGQYTRIGDKLNHWPDMHTESATIWLLNGSKTAQIHI